MFLTPVTDWSLVHLIEQWETINRKCDLYKNVSPAQWNLHFFFEILLAHLINLLIWSLWLASVSDLVWVSKLQKSSMASQVKTQAETSAPSGSYRVP